MLAEYLSGGLRVFAGLVKVCRREDKLSVRRFHSPKTNFFVKEKISEGARGSPTSTAPPQEALVGPPVGLFIPTDVDRCWTPY
ncbi:hypothetical protein DPMN_074506 [Dreissena polymorpha]|uniref:Uncharacterized protein n=1 Tax=Dreissena polymorpha TaxID=45954 RepID=A0A9D3YIR8_DREPO|nr:hypothetical protein DPMN_074506 [Dreissena polymorpha]